MSTIKPKRTLGPAQFEAFMGFADSLKDGTNNDALNKFKYNMAVREGYIKPQLEAAGGFTAENLKQGINGLLQVFMPLLDSGEQAIVGGVMEEFDKAVAAGKNPAEVFFGNGGDDEESEDETEPEYEDDSEVEVENVQMFVENEKTFEEVKEELTTYVMAKFYPNDKMNEVTKVVESVLGIGCTVNDATEMQKDALEMILIKLMDRAEELGL